MRRFDNRPPRLHLILSIALLAAILLAACQPSLPTAMPTATSGPPDPAQSGAPADVEVAIVASPTVDPPTPTSEPEPTQPPPPPPEPIGPENYPPNVNRLTGLSVDDPSVLARRPLLIKISNAPEVVRPQSGTSRADIMFEYYVEGGWTRFAAIFYGQDTDHIGPVRSGRLPDLQLSPAFDAIMVFSGGSQGVIDTIRESDLFPYLTMSPQFGLAEPYFVRFPREGLAWEHTLYTNTESLWGLAAERNLRETAIPAPGMAFHALPPEGGTPAAAATLDYAKTSVRWQYDPVTGQYLRWTDGLVHTDAVTAEQLGFENVLVIGSTLELHDLFPEKYFGVEQSLYIELTGNGPATLLRDGQRYEGRWMRTEMGTFQFVGANGQPMYLKPGRTFVQVVRTGMEQLIVRP